MYKEDRHQWPSQSMSLAHLQSQCLQRRLKPNPRQFQQNCHETQYIPTRYCENYDYMDDEQYDPYWTESAGFDTPNVLREDECDQYWYKDYDTEQEDYNESTALYSLEYNHPYTSHSSLSQHREVHEYPYYSKSQFPDYNYSNTNHTYQDYYGNYNYDENEAYEKSWRSNSNPNQSTYKEEIPKKRSYQSISTLPTHIHHIQDPKEYGYKKAFLFPTSGSEIESSSSSSDSPEDTSVSKDSHKGNEADIGDSLISDNVQKYRLAVENMESKFMASKQKIYTQKLHLLKKQLESVQKEEYEPFKEHIKSLSDIRNKTIEKAKIFMDYQLACIEKQYDTERQTVENELLTDRHELQVAMTSFIDERNKRLKVSEKIDGANDKSTERNNGKDSTKTADIAEELMFFARNRNKLRLGQDLLTADKLFAKKSGMLRAVANRRHTVDRMKDRANLDAALTSMNITELDSDLASIRKSIAKSKDIGRKIGS
ncbi:hypothetical protein CLU79DRAFT_732716 [Phycomyces nitens]|nr:hypothetical protein CLU79DRAFT_732716 [Phycomyces nitens]